MMRSYSRVLALVAGAAAVAMRPGAKRKSATPPPAARTATVVFFADNSRLQPDAHKQRAEVEALCAQHRLSVEWPSEHIFYPTEFSVAERVAMEAPPIDDPRPGRVLHKVWLKMLGVDAVVAEITPFRGVHMNPVVAFEIGIAVAIDLPIFAWTTAVWPSRPGQAPRFKLLDDRIWCGDKVAPDGNWRDEEDGTLVENFGMIEPAQIAGNFTSLSDSRDAAIRSCAQYLANGGTLKGPARSQ